MTEFKDALKAVTNLGDGGELIDAWTDHERTILLALRIADRLMGEPSEAMVAHGQEYAYHEMKQHALGCFKAMRDQLLREIEQEGD